MFKAILISQLAGPLIRHGMTAVGVWIGAQGLVDEATTQQIVGGGVALGSLVLSYAEKHLRL